MTASTNAPATLRLLAVHAHPDDESSKGAATMAMYAAAGVEVMVATCTDGSRGDIQNPAVEGEPHPKRDMAGARRLEMDQAAKVLGIQQRWLGFTDSGLPEGDPLPPLPTGSFAVQPLERAAAPLVRLVRDFKPHVIVSYDENGGYPHPDHIMAHRVAVEAFAAAGDPSRYPDAGAAWEPSKLYYDRAFSPDRFRALHFALEEAGLQSPYAQRLAAWLETDAEGHTPPQGAHATTTQIDCGDFLRPATTHSARTARRLIRWGSSLPCRPRCSAACGLGKTTP
ncbi:mycothiol S-conjugate amidase Mca [Arthrobacter sp. Hiyo4]|nr:mycothiol S-conjugate amidase Mca [Arthrobacter sp. Hiyo4]